MKHIVYVFLISIICLAFFTDIKAQNAAKIGKIAPEIHITKWLKGKTDLKGKTILLTFFESWCGNCRRIVNQMNELAKKYSSNDFVFLYLSSENLDMLKSYLNGVEIVPSIVHDEGDTTINSYGVTIIPESFLINKEGILVWQGHPWKLVDKHFEDYLKTGKTPEKRFTGPV